MRRLLLILLCSFFYQACSSGETNTRDSPEAQEVVIPDHLQGVENLTVLSVDSVPQYKIDLVRETNYGDKDDEAVFLGYINDFEVDDKGRVYLADAINDQIHVYNPDGSFLQSIGRSGRGPGEFLTSRRQLNVETNDDHLVVYDDTNYRITRFSLETFKVVDIVNLDLNKWNQIEEISGSRPFDQFLRSDGTYLVNFYVRDYTVTEPGMYPRTGHEFVYQFNQKFEPISEKIVEIDLPEVSVSTSGNSGGRIFSFPFTNRTLTAFSRSGQIYKASSEEFLISIHEPDGTYLRSIYYPVEAVTFTNQDREKLVEERSSYGRGFSEFGVPDHWPVLNQITVDDENRLWVSIITADYDSTEWWVLDENFNILAKFPWPRKITDRPGDDIDHKFIIRNGAMYYLGTDAMNLDQQTVIRYRIELSPLNSEDAGE